MALATPTPPTHHRTPVNPPPHSGCEATTPTPNTHPTLQCNTHFTHTPTHPHPHCNSDYEAGWVSFGPGECICDTDAGYVLSDTDECICDSATGWVANLDGACEKAGGDKVAAAAIDILNNCDTKNCLEW